MNELSLFTGGGGGLLASRLLGWRTVCAVELDPYCRAVLLRRQDDGVLDPFPVWDDIKTFDGKPWRGRVDVVSGGFPCQPFSTAGRGLGSADERNLWPDTIRVLREVGARYALLENVPALLAHDYFGTVLGDLAEAGFDAEWGVLGAGDLGAIHERERLWIRADAAGQRHEEPGDGRRNPGYRPQAIAWETTDALDALARGAVPVVCRDHVRLPGGVDRLRALGNAQVPVVAAAAWRSLA